MTSQVARSELHVPGHAHDILLVALIALRPLIWSGDAGAWDNLAWLLLAIAALCWLVIDAWRGRVPAWRFGIGGALAALLLAFLLPAALRSPYPSTGMGLWGMAVIHLGFAAYLMQVVPGRERLAFAALAGALVVECLIAFGQWVWVLPGMTTALAGGDPTVAALENVNGDLANRVAYGGLFGTFTLANTLAAFLLLVAVPFVGLLTAGHGRQRLIAGAVVTLAAAVAIGTASKGAAVALVLAGALGWTLTIQGRLRWLALISVGIGGLAIATIPVLRDLGAASAHVRLGYWHGAMTLIAEAPLLGHGIHGFAAHGSRTMPLDAEPTRHVHNDVLEATVDGGLLAGVGVLALLGWCARRRLAAPTTLSNDATEVTSTWQAAWPLLLIFPLFSAIGMLVSNVEWWPLGAGEMTWWLWPLLLAGVVIAVAMLSTRLPLPPAWAWQLALTAFALHCLVDFNLQSPAIWGTLILVAVLAGGRTTMIGRAYLSRSVATVLVLGVASGFAVGLVRSGQFAQASRFLDDAREDHQIRAAFVAHPDAYDHLAFQWPANSRLQVDLVSAVPPGKHRFAVSHRLAQAQPWNAQAQELFAYDAARSGAWTEALAAMRQAVANNPGYLPRRQQLVDLLVRAARSLPSQAHQLFAEAARESQIISDLTPRVHPRNRLPLITDSALPIQPAP